MGRPENEMPPQCFYDEKEATKYTNCTRIIKIQSEMSERCLELLNIPDLTLTPPQKGPQTPQTITEFLNSPKNPQFILDLGCGSGLSGDMISQYGHLWWGFDISPNMLDIALQRDTPGEIMLSDLGQGFNFTPGFFDYAISVSALQWLCNADKSCHDPWKRLLTFFGSLQKALRNGGKAAIQLYPENSKQLEMISNAAIKSGFAGGIYVDFPNSTTAKKYYLILNTAVEGKLGIVMKEGRNEVGEECEKVKGRRKKRIKKRGKFDHKSRYWVYQKKERQRKQGKNVRIDTKYTGRKRKVYF